MDIETINPATEEVIASYPILKAAQLDKLIEKGHAEFLSWQKTPFSHRRSKMSGLADIIRAKQQELAEIISNEMGKPITSAKGEIEKCAWVCQHYAEHAEEYLQPREIETEMAKTKVCYRPTGIIFAIMPWNFPFWQVFRFAAPNIMAGNAGILKHASISLGAGSAIADLFQEAGFPQYLFQHFILDNELAALVIANDKISGVTLTGSDRAGREVGAVAAKYMKKMVLELGGSDPYVILEDADLELAADQIVKSRMANTGQVCIAAKRVIAVDEVIPELEGIILDKVKNYKMGPPLDENTNFGPMARKDLRETLHEQVQETIAMGAKLLVGGEIPKGRGFYYPPTVLTNVTPGMPAFDDELFGPVISIISAKDEEDAISLANNTSFGLGAAVFTVDEERGEKIATFLIEAGSCFVNSLVASDPRVPFGGIKQSGHGRELSREGILEFMNTKTIAIR